MKIDRETAKTYTLILFMIATSTLQSIDNYRLNKLEIETKALEIVLIRKAALQSVVLERNCQFCHKGEYK